MGLKGYRLWVMGQLDSNVQSPTVCARMDVTSFSALLQRYKWTRFVKASFGGTSRVSHFRFEGWKPNRAVFLLRMGSDCVLSLYSPPHLALLVVGGAAHVVRAPDARRHLVQLVDVHHAVASHNHVLAAFPPRHAEQRAE
jgi:hypothetical protein